MMTMMMMIRSITAARSGSTRLLHSSSATTTTTTATTTTTRWARFHSIRALNESVTPNAKFEENRQLDQGKGRVDPLTRQYYELCQQWMTARRSDDSSSSPLSSSAVYVLQDGTIVRKQMKDAFIMIRDRFERYEEDFAEENVQREALETLMEEEEEREEERKKRDLQKRIMARKQGLKGLIPPPTEAAEEGAKKNSGRDRQNDDDDNDDDDGGEEGQVSPMKAAYENMLKREKREKELERCTRKVGVYVTGREGMGKSTMLNVLVRMARLAGWNVVHVPDCRQWVSVAIEGGIYDNVVSCVYLLNEVFRGWEEQERLIGESGAPDADELVNGMFCFSKTTFKVGQEEVELTWKELVRRGMDPTYAAYDPVFVCSHLMDYMRRDTSTEHLLVLGHHEIIFESLGDASGHDVLDVPLMARFPFMEAYPRLTSQHYKRMSVFFAADSTYATADHAKFMPMYRQIRPEPFSLQEFETLMSQQSDLPEIIASQDVDTLYTTLQSITRPYPKELNDLVKFAREHGPHMDFQDLVMRYTETIEEKHRNIIRGNIRIMGEEDRILVYNDIFDFTFQFLSSRMFHQRPQIPLRITNLLLNNSIGEEVFMPDPRYEGCTRHALIPLYPMTAKVLLEELAINMPDIRADEGSLRSKDLYALLFPPNPERDKAWYIMSQRETVTREIARCLIESTAAGPDLRYSIRTSPVDDPTTDSTTFDFSEMRKCHIVPMRDVVNVDSVFDNLPAMLQEISGQHHQTPNEEQVMVVPKTGSMTRHFDFFIHRPSHDKQGKPSLIAFKVIDSITMSYPGSHDIDLPDIADLTSERYESVDIVFLSLVHTKDLAKRYKFIPVFGDNGNSSGDQVRVTVAFLEDYLYTQHWKAVKRYCMQQNRKEKDIEEWHREGKMKGTGTEKDVDNVLRSLARKDSDNWMWL